MAFDQQLDPFRCRLRKNPIELSFRINSLALGHSFCQAFQSALDLMFSLIDWASPATTTRAVHGPFSEIVCFMELAASNCWKARSASVNRARKTAIVQLTIAVFEFASFCSDSPHPNRIFAEQNATWPFTARL